MGPKTWTQRLLEAAKNKVNETISGREEKLGVEEEEGRTGC